LGTLMELLEELNAVLARLSEDAERGVPLLVEGRSDIKALRELGINGCFIAVKANRKPLPDLALDICQMASEAIILLDFDSSGREDAMRLACELERLGVKADLGYWRQLRALVGSGSFTKDIEGLPSFIETLMRKLGLRHG